MNDYFEILNVIRSKTIFTGEVKKSAFAPNELAIRKVALLKKGCTSENDSSDSDLRDPASYHAHTVRIQSSEHVTPAPARSQACNLLVLADLDLIEFLQIDKNAWVVDAGEAWVRRMTATADGKFGSEESDIFERFGYILR